MPAPDQGGAAATRHFADALVAISMAPAAAGREAYL